MWPQTWAHRPPWALSLGKKRTYDDVWCIVQKNQIQSFCTHKFAFFFHPQICKWLCNITSFQRIAASTTKQAIGKNQSPTSLAATQHLISPALTSTCSQLAWWTKTKCCKTNRKLCIAFSCTGRSTTIGTQAVEIFAAAHWSKSYNYRYPGIPLHWWCIGLAWMVLWWCTAKFTATLLTCWIQRHFRVITLLRARPEALPLPTFFSYSFGGCKEGEGWAGPESTSRVIPFEGAWWRFSMWRSLGRVATHDLPVDWRASHSRRFRLSNQLGV